MNATTFTPGIQVQGRADPARVVIATHNPGVTIRCAPDIRQKWAALAMAERVILQSRAAINHYTRIQEEA